VNPHKAFFGLLGLIGLSILGVALVFTFLQNGLADPATTIGDLKADLELTERQVQVYESAQAKVEELAFVNELAEEVLPSDKSQAEVVSQLKKFAEDTGTSIKLIEFVTGPEETGDPSLSQTNAVEGLAGIRALEVNLTLQEGLTYKQFLAYLEKVENSRRKMQVIQISITPDPENRNSLSSALLSIQIYLKG